MNHRPIVRNLLILMALAGASVCLAAAPPPPMLDAAAATGEEGGSDLAVRLLPARDTIYLHDGTELHGTVLIVGQKAVIYHTSDGEASVPREKVLRVQYRKDAGVHKAYKAEKQDGHIFLTSIEDPEALKRKFAARSKPSPRKPGAQRPGTRGAAGSDGRADTALDAAIRPLAPDMADRLPADVESLDIPPHYKALLEKLRKK